MPSLDMRVALTNPMTLDTFDVIRRAQANNDSGEVQITATPFPKVRGVVTPGSAMKDLQRMDAEQRQTKAITIVTRFALRGASEDQGQQDFQPDIVVWHGDNYLVIFLDDYSNYAAGFVRAVCLMMDMNAVPPVTK